MGIPDAKAAVDKEWEKLEKLLAWRVTKVKSKKEAIEKSQKEGRTVHFATLMTCATSRTRSCSRSSANVKVVLCSEVTL